MTHATVDIDGCCKVSVKVRIPGRTQLVSEDAVIDTGFFHSDADVGLVLPTRLAPGAGQRGRGTLSFTLANGEEEEFQFDPGVSLMEIGPVSVPEPTSVGAIFAPRAGILLGFNVLRRGSLHLDGPNSIGQFSMP